MTTANTSKGIILVGPPPRLYWTTSCEKGGGGSPSECQSQEGLRGSGNPGGDCSHCPLSQVGSAPTGEGQAWKQFHLICMLRPDSFIPCVVKAPPTSLKELQSYHVGLSGREIASHHCVPSLGRTTKKNKRNHSYSEIRPRRGQRLNSEEIVKINSSMKIFHPFMQQINQDALEDTASFAEEE